MLSIGTGFHPISVCNAEIWSKNWKCGIQTVLHTLSHLITQFYPFSILITDYCSISLFWICRLLVVGHQYCYLLTNVLAKSLHIATHIYNLIYYIFVSLTKSTQSQRYTHHPCKRDFPPFFMNPQSLIIKLQLEFSVQALFLRCNDSQFSEIVLIFQ